MSGELKAPKSISDQILIETLHNLEKGDVFDSKTIIKLKKSAKNGLNKNELISILEEGLGEDTQTED